MIRRAATFRSFCGLHLLIAVPAVVGALAVRAAELDTPSPPASRPLNILRVYAPADKIEDWPRGEEKYIPISAAEFEKKWKTAQGPAVETARQTHTRLVKTEFTCRLTKDALEGTGAFEIVHEGASPVRFGLDPCEFALANPRWEHDPSVPAKLTVDRHGQLSIWVERSGRLLVVCSLHGQRDNGDVLTFSLAVPPCPTTNIQLNVPADRMVTTEQGLVSDGTPEENGERRRFQVELGGRNEGTLKIVPAAAARERHSLTLLREQLVYDFSERGVTVTARFKLDVHQEPLRKLAVVVDAPLRVLAAQFGEQSLNWTVVDAGPRATRVELDLADHPILGTNRWVEIAAMMALPKGKIHLPRLRAQDTLWQGGTSTVLVSAPLLLQHFQIQGGRQIKSGALPAPASGESLETQWYSPQADVEVAVARRTDDLQIEKGTTFTLSNREMTAQAVCDLRVAQGDRFELTPEIPRQWIVDSVETIPPGGLADWAIEERDADWQPLTIHLKQALRPNRPLKLSVQGRWRKAPLGEAITPADLQLLRFPDARPVERLVELRAADSFRLKLTDADELRRVDPRQLTAEEAALFRSPPTGVMFRKEFADVGPLKVEVLSRPERFDVQIHVDAAVHGQELQERFSFLCTPKGGPVDAVRVEFPQALSANLRWKLLHAESDAFTARLLTVEERRAAGLSENGEIWEIKLSSASAAPFELQAEGARAWTGPTPVDPPPRTNREASRFGNRRAQNYGWRIAA